MSAGEFSVYTFTEDGFSTCMRSQVDAKSAVLWAHLLTVVPEWRRPHRVIITDGGDFCCFEWIRGKGVTFGTSMNDEAPS